MFDSCDVAAYIAQECVERKISYTNTKIQKLLYCGEHPHALPYGPVFP